MLQRWQGSLFGGLSRRRSRRAEPTCRPTVERLEPRLAPAAGLSESGLAHYIVVLNDQVTNPGETAPLLAGQLGGLVGNIYQHALKGFSAALTPAAAEALRHNPLVQYVQQDAVVHAFAQTLPTGVDRIDADQNPTANINGVTDAVIDVDVAIIDTGINKTHPDLNVAGGRNFARTLSQILRRQSPDPNAWNDDNGHGTHVAGTVAAKDDGVGVVGVAPGARLWGVKVLGSDGSGYMADIIAGVDWVTSTRTDANTANDIEVANMSLGGWGVDSTPLHTAIKKSVAAGVIYVAAAGNEGKDIYGADGVFGGTDDTYPAAYPEVMTISALSDSDGKPGGLGAPSSFGDPDDSFAFFSNFSRTDVNAAYGVPVTSPGRGIDLILPGVDITSTWLNGGYAKISGTSMAAPHAAGLVALYIAKNGRAENAAGVYAIRQALINAAKAQGAPEGLKVLNDPDGNRENFGWAGVSNTQPPPPSPVTDVAVTGVTPRVGGNVVTSVERGTSVSVEVTVENKGNRSVTNLTVTLKDGSTIVDTRPVDPLAPGASTKLTFTWNTNTATTGDHVLTAKRNLSDDNSSNDSATATVKVTDPIVQPPPGNVLYFTVRQTKPDPVGGLAVQDEDIVKYDGVHYSVFFDGTPLLVSTSVNFAIDAFEVLSPTEILISVDRSGRINGSALSVSDEDIVKFTQTSSGWSASLYFDGSHVGLLTTKNSDEGVDALEVLPGGTILVSTKGAFSVTGVSGQDEDVLAFKPTSTSTGPNTVGSWSLFFDGSNYGLGDGGENEDVDGIARDAAGNLYLSTRGAFSVPGVSGTGADVFVLAGGTYSATKYFTGSTAGLGSNTLADIDVPPGDGTGAPLALLAGSSPEVTDRVFGQFGSSRTAKSAELEPRITRIIRIEESLEGFPIRVIRIIRGSPESSSSQEDPGGVDVLASLFAGLLRRPDGRDLG